MAVSAERVTVSSTAVALNPAESGVSGGRLYIKNSATEAADVLVLGPASVTNSSGFALAAGATVEVTLSFGERIYAIRGASTDIVAHVLRLGE